jgi:hypothetical protein
MAARSGWSGDTLMWTVTERVAECWVNLIALVIKSAKEEPLSAHSPRTLQSVPKRKHITQGRTRHKKGVVSVLTVELLEPVHDVSYGGSLPNGNLKYSGRVYKKLVYTEVLKCGILHELELDIFGLNFGSEPGFGMRISISTTVCGPYLLTCPLRAAQ